MATGVRRGAQEFGQGEQRFAQPSDVLKKLEEVGAAAGILISSRQPLLAVDKDNYRELPVKCRFEATTESLVKFLYGLQRVPGSSTSSNCRSSRGQTIPISCAATSRSAPWRQDGGASS